MNGNKILILVLAATAVAITGFLIFRGRRQQVTGNINSSGSSSSENKNRPPLFGINVPIEVPPVVFTGEFPINIGGAKDEGGESNLSALTPKVVEV